MELEALRSDMIAAMKAKDKARKEAISSLISAAKKVAIDEGCRDDIKPELVDRVILKELKTVKEQIDTCPASREDLKAEYQFRYQRVRTETDECRRSQSLHSGEIRRRSGNQKQRRHHESCYGRYER